mmetsp:Transcript_9246/g.28137  ORF Transcript_9246/g.28137 Transcript_9246/m.28137 type:complete len:205 (-) Transcript_9246:93-707(-)
MPPPTGRMIVAGGWAYAVLDRSRGRLGEQGRVVLGAASAAAEPMAGLVPGRRAVGLCECWAMAYARCVADTNAEATSLLPPENSVAQALSFVESLPASEGESNGDCGSCVASSGTTKRGGFAGVAVRKTPSERLPALLQSCCPTDAIEDCAVVSPSILSGLASEHSWAGSADDVPGCCAGRCAVPRPSLCRAGAVSPGVGESKS